jgi:hypothetical protein
MAHWQAGLKSRDDSIVEFVYIHNRYYRETKYRFNEVKLLKIYFVLQFKCAIAYLE